MAWNKKNEWSENPKKNIKQLRDSPSQLFYWLDVRKIPEIVHKNALDEAENFTSLTIDSSTLFFANNFLKISENPWTATSESSKKAW